MKQRAMQLLAVSVALLACLCVPMHAAAQSGYVVDGAALFSAEETAQLEAACAEVAEEIGQDLVIVTTEDTGGKTSRAYADDYFDDNGYGRGAADSGALLLFNMQEREVWISTYGDSIAYFTDSRIDRTLDAVAEELASGEYYGAAAIFLRDAESYFTAGFDEEYFHYDESSGTVRERSPLSVEMIVIFAVFSIGVAFVVCWTIVRRYKGKSGGYSYPFRQ